MKKVLIFAVFFTLTQSFDAFSRDRGDRSNSSYRDSSHKEDRDSSRREFKLQNSSDSSSDERGGNVANGEFNKRREEIMKKCKAEMAKLRQEYGMRDSDERKGLGNRSESQENSYDNRSQDGSRNGSRNRSRSKQEDRY
jgi:hypothetical protein